MSLSVQELLKGRDNNFNLIRFLAAVAVIYDHSFMVPNGERVPWLLPNVMSSDFGWYAVNVFFILSGFLVTKSWLSGRGLASYLIARGLRLFPALFVSAVILAFVAGPIVCSCPITEYFADLRAWLYVPLTASLISPSETLPFVFDELPASSIVNSPLWTLRYEALSYLAIAFLGVLGLFATRFRALGFMLVFFSGYLGITLLTGWREESTFLDSVMRFWLCFFLGATAFLVSDRLTLRASTAVILMLAAALAYGTAIYEFALQIAIAYGVFWLALVPGGAIRHFNRLGDYSYGLYIFAWPIQQVVFSIAPSLSPHQMFVLATPIILLVAAASWHWIEKPSIDARGAVTNWAMRHRSRVSNLVSSFK